ncbi:MAG: hypothetical protein M3N13_07915, partial [Candidatus Eremiobacteraeota bacterium]|nr:hypothetical protein [Candidatus Eremiobacteraeota bacterium]
MKSQSPSRTLALVALAALAACSGGQNASTLPVPLSGANSPQSMAQSQAPITHFGGYLRHTPDVDQEAFARLGAKSLPLWSRSFTYKGSSYSYTMVGTDPAKGSVSTRVPVILVPMKFTFTGGASFDATQKTQTLPV